VKDKDRQVLPSMNGDADLPERLWAYDDFMFEQDQPVSDFSAGLVSLGYIRAGLRRSARLWCATAAAGFVVGLGLAVAAPPSYQASTTILLTHNSSDDAVDAMQTDLALAQSHTVAERTMAKLNVKENVDAFVSAETITPTTDRILQITVSAPSSAQAVARASTVASEFLTFRAQQLQDQQQLVGNGLDQQINQAKNKLAAINEQIHQLSGQTGQSDQSDQSDQSGQSGSATQAKLTQLNAQKTDATNSLGALQQTVAANQSSAEAQILGEIKGSQVLDAAAPVHHSALKFDLIYALIGLFIGLVAGLAFVIIRSLITDRLRRRDDIADALGTPITVSAGPIQEHRWWPSWPRTRMARASDLQRLVTSLRGTLPSRRSGTAALAMVAVDNQREVARLLVALATDAVRSGRNVVLADLSHGTPAARLLGASTPGIHAVRVDGGQLAVAVPAEHDAMPVGPRDRRQPQRPGHDDDGALTAAYQQADLLLTLVNLDPSLGADNLPTWAPDAAVVVTAGRSTWLRINAVSEMVRMSGTKLAAAVLVGTDKSDESLGRSPAMPPQGPMVTSARGH
jgi:capsular polysaccharide biosynthesis protein